MNGTKILLVEDNEDHIILFEEAVPKEYEVDVARNGREAFNKIAGAKYDLILLDYALPDASGLEILKKIREREYDAPVVMVTGQGSESVAVEALTSGAVDYIIKTPTFYEGVRHSIERNLERYRLQQEIKETRDHLRNILNTIQEKICAIDRDYNIVSFNNAFARDLKKDKIAGEKCYRVLHGYSDEEFKKFCETRCIVRKAFKTKKPAKSSHEHWLEDGSIVYHESKALPFANQDTETNHVVYIVDDVTEKRRLEREIERTKNFLDGIVKNAPVGIFTTDKNGVITFANPMHLKMMGETKVEQALGLNVLELPTVKALGWDELFRKALQGKPFELHNVKYTSIYGKTVYLTALCTPLKIGSKVEGLLVVMEDVTQQAKLQKKVEERTKALQESEERYRTLVESAPDGIYSVAVDGTIVSLNPAFERLTGWSRTEWLGRPFVEIIHPNDLPVAMENFQCALRGEKLQQHELRVLSKSGEYLTGEFVTVPQVEKGKIVGVFGIARDVTERKRADEALRNYAAKLEEANQLKDLFTDIMTHDLLNPVGVIRNYAEIMLGEESDDKKIQGLRSIKKNAERIIDLIENASKYERLAGIEKLDFEEADLNSIVEEVVHAFEPMLKAKKIEVEYKAEGECPVKVNPVIEDVFSNLISNAIKYSPEGSKIVVGIEDYNNSWRVMVKDCGEGVPDEYKEAIFERFRRGGKKGVKGTGLGLAIVKRTVELHKGRVWVEDNPEGGSIFYATLPK